MTLSTDVSVESLYDLTNKDSYQALYLSVILQAILDLCKHETEGEPSEIKVQRDQADAWFFSSIGVTCEDFETVCLYAKVDPVKRRVFAYETMKSGDTKNVRRKFQSLL